MAVRIAQWVKALAVTPGGLSCVLQAHVEGKNQPLQVLFCTHSIVTTHERNLERWRQELKSLYISLPLPLSLTYCISRGSLESQNSI